MTAAGLPWRPYVPTAATVAHRHAVGLVRLEVEDMGRAWICERELTDKTGKTWRTAVEVILRQLVRTYDDVVYRAAPNAFPLLEKAIGNLREDAN